MTERGVPTGWGPDSRRAAVTVVLDGIAAWNEEGHLVSPSLPTILRVLTDLDLHATFLTEPEVAEWEPFAVTMIESTQNEVAEPGATAASVLSAEEITDSPDPGLPPDALHRALQVAVATNLEHGRHLSLTFIPAHLERPDGLAIFVETLKLVAGLERAGRLWIPMLGELTASRSTMH